MKKQLLSLAQRFGDYILSPNLLTRIEHDSDKPQQQGEGYDKNYKK